MSMLLMLTRPRRPTAPRQSLTLVDRLHGTLHNLTAACGYFNESAHLGNLDATTMIPFDLFNVPWWGCDKSNAVDTLNPVDTIA